jgi:hypothetical protein
LQDGQLPSQSDESLNNEHTFEPIEAKIFLGFL